MPYIGGTQVGKLKVLLKKERLSVKFLFEEMHKQCTALGIQSLSQQEISKMSFGDRPDRHISHYLKVLNALNALRRNGHEAYTLDDLIEPDEILKPKK
jgi:hypothetical protein